MKDSGVDWLGEIPADWEVKRIASLFKERNNQVSAAEYEPLSVTKKGVVPQLDTAAKSDSTETRKLIKKGDFVINSRSDRKGSSGLSSLDGSCSSIYIVLEPKGIDGKFAHELFRSQVFQEEFYRWGTGIVDDLWSTRYARMKMISIPVPPENEIQRIISYLDQETSKIDLLISKKEQLIEKLLERRQALITQVVTKGLDPSVPMKDSGIERLGFVPSNWRLEKVKAAFSRPVRSTGLIKGQASLESAPGTFPGYSASGQDVFISKELAIPEHEPGLVLSSVGARCGRTFLAMEENWGLVANTEGWIISKEYDPLFVWFVCQNSELWIRGGSAQPYVQTPLSIANKVPWPNKDMQESISNYLAVQTSKIDHLTNSIYQAIKLLKERRQALITQVVTGKLDVRGLSDGDS